MQELTAKPQTGPRDSRGFCWATKRLLPAANMVPEFSWSGPTTQRANRCRRKSVLEPNLYLSLSCLSVTSIIVLFLVLSTFRGRMISGCVISFDWSKEGGGTFGLLPHINRHVSCSTPTLPSANTTRPISFNCVFWNMFGFLNRKQSSEMKCLFLTIISNSSLVMMVSGTAPLRQMFRVESLDNGVEVINKLAEV